MPTLKSLVKTLIPASTRAGLRQRLLKSLIGYDFESPTFSSAGEDAIINYLFGFTNSGFFVDVGAWHPSKASNTYLFSLKGWSGINIDACPGSMKAFAEARPRDVNLEVAISDKAEKLTYYSHTVGNSSMNTFDEGFMAQLGLQK